MTAATIPAEQLRCSHNGIHGPDEEPGAVQRCFEETVALRTEHSEIGRKVSDTLQQLVDDLLPELTTRTIRETLRLVNEDGRLTDLRMDLRG